MTHTVTHTAQKTQRTGGEVRLPVRCAVLLFGGGIYLICAMRFPMV